VSDVHGANDYAAAFEQIKPQVNVFSAVFEQVRESHRERPEAEVLAALEAGFASAGLTVWPEVAREAARAITEGPAHGHR
jgi:hypothetical protein